MTAFRFRLKTRTYFNDPPVVPPVPPPPAPVTFTQEQVNAILKKEREKDQAAANKEKQELIAQLEALKSSKGLSVQEKADLEARIEQLSTQHMTETQRLQASLDKVSKESKATIETLTEGAKKWQSQHHTLLITQGIVAGSIAHKAADPTGEQLAAMLIPRAKVVEVVDDAGNATGVYQAVLPVTTLDKQKKPVVVELPIVEAIGKLREDPKNANLFLTDGKPGLGGSNGGRGGSGGKATFDPSMSPSDYRKNRQAIIDG